MHNVGVTLTVTGSLLLVGGVVMAAIVCWMVARRRISMPKTTRAPRYRTNISVQVRPFPPMTMLVVCSILFLVSSP